MNDVGSDFKLKYISRFMMFENKLENINKIPDEIKNIDILD